MDTHLEAIRTQLRALAEPRFREGAARYFQGSATLYGVRAPAVRRIAQELYREVRAWPLAQRNRLCTELWKGGTLEEGGVAIYLYQRFHRQCGLCEFQLFEKWIDRFVHNWAHCDGVATGLVAAAIRNEPALLERVPPWTASQNRWKRRAAAVSLVREARAGRHTAEILRVADALLADADDMVRKGVGWLLKDAYPAKPKEVLAFLLPRAARAPRLALRIACEKMTASDRAAVRAAG